MFRHFKLLYDTYGGRIPTLPESSLHKIEQIYGLRDIVFLSIFYRFSQ